MRHRIIDLFARMPALLAAIVALSAAGSASAGRQRVLAPTETGGGLPATPEPGAAIAFAVGIGVVAWVVRRNRNR